MVRQREEIYYALDSNNISDENYEAVKDNLDGKCRTRYRDCLSGRMQHGRFGIRNDLQCDHWNSSCGQKDGVAVRLYQNLWTAKSEAFLNELCGYATGIYENAYSCDDLMQVIGQFSEDADPQSFRELTEASDLDSAKERIFSN